MIYRVCAPSRPNPPIPYFYPSSAFTKTEVLDSLSSVLQDYSSSLPPSSSSFHPSLSHLLNSYSTISFASLFETKSTSEDDLPEAYLISSYLSSSKNA